MYARIVYGLYAQQWKSEGDLCPIQRLRGPDQQRVQSLWFVECGGQLREAALPTLLGPALGNQQHESVGRNGLGQYHQPDAEFCSVRRQWRRSDKPAAKRVQQRRLLYESTLPRADGRMLEYRGL